MTNEITETAEQLNAKAEALKTQAAEVESQLAEIRKAERLAEQEATRKIELAKRIEEAKPAVVKLNNHAESISAALREVGINVEFKFSTVNEYGRATMPQFNLPYQVQVTIEAAYGRGSRRWSNGPFKGYKVVVGPAGETKTFPQKADGTFNYDKIATEVATRISNDLAEKRRNAEREQERSKAKLTIEYVAKSLGGAIVEGGYDYRGRYESRTPVLTMSAETAQKLYERLGELEVKASLYDARLADEQNESKIEWPVETATDEQVQQDAEAFENN